MYIYLSTLFYAMLFKRALPGNYGIPSWQEMLFFFQKSIELACLFFYIKVNLHIQDEIT